jgi:DNA mismatch repair ATPase MutS
MLITGPNGGGKSATLKALLNNIVWAQTFGVAFASKFASTYFDLIVNRVSGDNTAKDSSRFVTEARSVAKFFKDILALNPNQFALIITDEMFSSTETKPAKMLSTEVCERIAQMKNTIYMLATHFKKLSCLEKTTNGIFKNYKVHVRKNPETGKLVYDYKLHPGVGTTNVAFDIFKEQLEKEGACDETILNLITAAQQRYHEETEENQDALPQPILVQ